MVEKQTTKVVLAFRVNPEIKAQFAAEAERHGLTVSEYGELLLANRVATNNEITTLKDSLKLKNQEIEQLRKGGQVKPPGYILPQPFVDRLKFLFEQVKGIHDWVSDPYGEDFFIAYERPEDFMKALIFSTKIR